MAHDRNRDADDNSGDGAGLAGADRLLVDDFVAEFQPPVEGLGANHVDDLDRGTDFDHRFGRRSQDKSQADHEGRQQAIKALNSEPGGGDNAVMGLRHGIRSVFSAFSQPPGEPSRSCCVFPGLKRKYYTKTKFIKDIEI